MLAFNATPSFYDELLSGYDILLFALGSCIVISVLLLYYSQIPENKNSKSALDKPLYQSKDVLLQSNNLEANFINTKKSASTFTKLFVFVLVFWVIFIPLYQLLGVNHFI
ncbi:MULTISPECIES: hypothetical protein [unclassified Polaribacter]|uniref:hypothetical protein n=1 Tax=unclassified Polaribacter TaxID=196858 RepID=UPI001677632F|nr:MULTISPECIES: hypothetical protein [unclassified Polaribacter]